MLKLIDLMILDLVIICITHARQIKSGKLIKWLNMIVFISPGGQLVDLVDILDFTQYRSNKMLAKEAELVFTFATAAPEERATTFPGHFCLYGGGQISFNLLLFPVFYSLKFNNIFFSNINNFIK